MSSYETTAAQYTSSKGVLFKGAMSRYLLSFKKLKLVFALIEIEFQRNGHILLFKTIFSHLNCFPSSVTKDGKVGHGLKIENVGSTLSRFTAMPAKITNIKIIVIITP